MDGSEQVGGGVGFSPGGTVLSPTAGCGLLQAVQTCPERASPETRMPPDPPLLIATYDLFRDHQCHTLRRVAEKLRVSKPAAREALERLEHEDVLVQARGGTEMPVWKRHPESEDDLFASLSVASELSERRRRRV